jgi:hypothetical protein
LRAEPITLVFSQQYFVTASLYGEKPGFFGLARRAHHLGFFTAILRYSQQKR